MFFIGFTVVFLFFPKRKKKQQKKKTNQMFSNFGENKKTTVNPLRNIFLVFFGGFFL
jgi:preprotein translocase subunit YajC